MDKNIFGKTPNGLKDWKKYGSLEEMPSDVRMQLEAQLRQLKNTPFVGKLFNGDQLDPMKVNEFMQGGKKTGAAVAILALGIMLLVGGIIFAVFQVIQTSEETFELTTDPTHFDPIASFEEVKSHVGANAQLTKIWIRYVRSDGTMDLTAEYNPNTKYSFFVEMAEGPDKETPPVGAGGNLDGKWYQTVDADVYKPGEWRHVMTMGGDFSSEYSYQNLGIDLDRGTPTGKINDTPLDPPKCSMKDLWDIAIKEGAPADAVATVDYDEGGYTFSIGDARIFMRFTPDCKLKE